MEVLACFRPCFFLPLLQFEVDFTTLHPNVNPLVLFTEWVNLSAFIVQQVQKKEEDFLTDPTLSKGNVNGLI